MLAGRGKVKRRSFRSAARRAIDGAMIYILLNAVPILMATLAGLVIGWLYWRMVAPRRRIGNGFAGLAFIAQAWLCAILAGALILAPPEAGVWTMTIGSAVVIWIGFVVPTMLVSERFRNVPVSASIGDCLHWLAVMLVQAVVLRLIGLVPPPG